MCGGGTGGEAARLAEARRGEATAAKTSSGPLSAHDHPKATRAEVCRELPLHHRGVQHPHAVPGRSHLSANLGTSCKRLVSLPFRALAMAAIERAANSVPSVTSAQ